MKCGDGMKNKVITVKIDGKDVPMKGGTEVVRLHKKYFKSDFRNAVKNHVANYKGTYDNHTHIAKIIWCFAKAANPKIKPYAEWLEDCETLPVRELITEIVTKLNGGM